MISHIKIPDTLTDSYIDSEKTGWINGLNRVNIFIGPNNSGKSRFLRGIFSENLDYQLKELEFQNFKQVADELLSAITEKCHRYGLAEIGDGKNPDIIAKLKDLSAMLGNPDIKHQTGAVKELLILVKRLPHFTLGSASHLPGKSSSADTRQLSIEIQILSSQYQNAIPQEVATVELPDFCKIYVPMLRGLRPTQISSNNKEFDNSVDNYFKRTVDDYFQGKKVSQGHLFKDSENKKLQVVTGLHLYEECKRLLLGTSKERKRIRDFETFLSKNFFNSVEVTLTPNIDKDCLYITFDNDDRPIYELGDGIQSIIILLYPLFFYGDQDLLYFIEEPELSLHPGMQRILVETLLDNGLEDVQIFLTTHSNHFLDITLDHRQISIFNFHRPGKKADNHYCIEIMQNEDIQLLDCLGVRNSSVFTSNCTIWVEGITDRLYLNKYLAIMQNKEECRDRTLMQEDLHYSFIEYGGGNIVHYSFDEDDNWEKIKAAGISNRIMVIVDEDGISENPSSKKYERIQELKKVLKENLIVLPCREIENLLSETTVQQILAEWEGDIEILKAIEHKDYQNEKFFEFVQNKLPDSKYTYYGKKGTTPKKLDLCKAVIAKLNHIDELSDHAKLVTTEILSFIRKNNL